jgi:hypothetical protein
VEVAEAVQEAAGVAAEEAAGEQRMCGNCGIYREPTRCTLNVSPRGHVTLFFLLQYGQETARAISFPIPVEPTTLIPRWHFAQRKIFCIRLLALFGW